MTTEYRKEFFDRQYTARESYGRLWKYARRYRFRIVVGIVCGILTAGTLLPLLQVVQPALEKVSQNEVEQALAEERPSESAAAAQPVPASAVVAPPAAMSALDRKIASKAKLPSWYPKAEKLAQRCGIDDGRAFVARFIDYEREVARR